MAKAAVEDMVDADGITRGAGNGRCLRLRAIESFLQQAQNEMLQYTVQSNSYAHKRALGNLGCHSNS